MAEEAEKLSLRQVVENAFKSPREEDESDDEAGETAAEEAKAEPIVPEGEPEEAAEVDEAPAKAAQGEKDRDDKGRFKKNAGKKDAAPEREERPGQPIVPGEEEKPAAAAEPEKPAISPPRSWKPAAREEWNKLPRSVQEEAFRVDLLLRKGASELAQAKKQAEDHGKNWQQFQEKVRPYEHMIRAEGSEPLKAVENLLQTAAALRTAPPQQKAQLMAEMAIRYGGREIVPYLDKAIVAAVTGQGQRAPMQVQSQALQDPRVDLILQRLEEGKKLRETEAAQKKQQEDEAASGLLEQLDEDLEFFGDLRDEVDIILASWEAKGKTRIEGDDWDTLYRMAAQMNPEVYPLYQQRQAAAAAERARPVVQRAKVAASSVRSSPSIGGPATNGAGKRPSLREVVAQAMAKQSERL